MEKAPPLQSDSPQTPLNSPPASTLNSPSRTNTFTTPSNNKFRFNNDADSIPPTINWEDTPDRIKVDGSINSSRPQPKKRGTNLWSKKLNVEADGTILEGESSSDDAFSRAGTTPSRPLAMRRGTGWNNLKLKLKLGGLKDLELPAGVGGSSSLTTELAMGLLPMVMIKMARLDRDDHDKKRIPVLMNFIKLSITSSTKSHSERHTSFRIELEYGDGLLKWVIYRELKDFVALHTHYRVANFRPNHGGGVSIPSFPKTSVSLLSKKSKKGFEAEGFEEQRRKSLEKYLLQLIRATMFSHTEGANRLCKFLEISAIAVSLATQGGEQGKQGYLRITSSGASRKKKSGLAGLLTLKRRHEPKWFIVRDSYIAAVDDPAGNEVWDVFLINSSFAIERPKRVYRQTLGLFSHDNNSSATVATTNLQLEDSTVEPREIKNIDKFKDSSNHTFYLTSNERRLRLVAKNREQQDQFIASIESVVSKSIWAGKNRFDSFAPVRLNVNATALVQGRDYFWSLSSALLLAKDTIHIHDWWLSPELYLRRPPAANEEFRLDRLLQRKAREGVKIYIIIYREVSNDFTPVDSTHTKNSLRALHPNIHVQRSPSHTSTGTLLWSHHEKMCVIDQTVGFCGGLDLCFGRWDTAQHVLVDDAPLAKGETVSNDQIFPGKDYANSRVLDFKELTAPFEDLFDRNKVPRQPWHDIGVQLIGQPARDLCRHFIQRWNLLLRTKNSTVYRPFLLPAPDFTAQQIADLRIAGTCEVQICRSVGPWSMNLTEVEHSIQTAYIKAISLSEHFIYIENQFFITSTEVESEKVTNRIGDSIVSRIIQAHTEGKPWRAIIVLPLVPGYTYPIDHEAAGSVRVIMACQIQSIAHGEFSIFARLRREGIDPDDYISFYSLRGWGKFSATGALTTEAVYIHAKAFIADDRVVIIGSANINERSQRGDRDSELACVIRDTDMIDSRMAGKPYQVGRFAHNLRIRLMKEHVGLDVEGLEETETLPTTSQPNSPNSMKSDTEICNPDGEIEVGADAENITRKSHPATNSMLKSAVDNGTSVISGAKEVIAVGLIKGTNRAGKVLEKVVDDTETEENDARQKLEGKKAMEGSSSTVVPTLEEKTLAREAGVDVHDTRQLLISDSAAVKSNGDISRPSAPNVGNENGKTVIQDLNAPPDVNSSNLVPSKSDGKANGIAAHQNSITDLLRDNLKEDKKNPYSIPLAPRKLKAEDLIDPLEFHETFMAIAVRNVQIFRKVFRCVPDDLVQTWSQYREYQAWADRHNKPLKDVVPENQPAPYFDSHHHSGQQGSGGGGSGGGSMGAGEEIDSNSRRRSSLANGGATESIAGRRARSGSFAAFSLPFSSKESTEGSKRVPSNSGGGAGSDGTETHSHEQGFPAAEREHMEELLDSVQGHLVIYPTRFLEIESAGSNFLFARDRLPPISIYN